MYATSGQETEFDTLTRQSSSKPIESFTDCSTLTRTSRQVGVESSIFNHVIGGHCNDATLTRPRPFVVEAPAVQGIELDLSAGEL